MKLKPIQLIILISIFFSCDKERILQLPETDNSAITEIKDISPAYLFYDETKKDSIELNRKNLIITTNWLVNVDKRLTLKQAIPHIIFLQNKKRNAKMHKNENAKNYFTCFNPDTKNLAFIEFTDVVYHEESSEKYFSKISDIPRNKRVNINFLSSERIELLEYSEDLKIINKVDLLNGIKNLITGNELQTEIVLHFNQNLTFQDYITYKTLLLKLNLPNVSISNDEFIY